jgi:PIN domain nuclease of toxin-antitoxin system
MTADGRPSERSAVSEIVLDASAVLAFFHGEPGKDVVARALPTAALLTGNLTEVVTRLMDNGMKPGAAHGFVDGLALEIAPLDEDLALSAAFLRTDTRKFGLSLADRACLALARARGVPALTADRMWRDVDVGVEIRLIRD